MISIQILALFFLASIMLGLAPGPDNLFVLTQSAIQGKRAGLIVTAGLCTGLMVHTTAVALGISVIFKTCEPAFNALKILGACYLLYLAYRAFRNKDKQVESDENASIPIARLYRRGVIMNLTNPKVALFFLAFLPQFTDPEIGSIPVQMILLGMIFILATILVFSSVAMLAGTAGQWIRRSPSSKKIMNRAAGIIFIGLALKLAAAERW